MSTAHCVFTFVLFAFYFVVLCATDVCGEYSAGVLRGGDVDAHGPKYIYAAGKRRWQMRAILQSGQDEGVDRVKQVDQPDSENVSPSDSETKLTDTHAGVANQATDRDGTVRGDNELATGIPGDLPPQGAADLESTTSTGHTLSGSVPAGGGGGRGGSNSGGTSLGSDPTKSRLPGPESPKEAAPTARENDQGGRPVASTSDAPENSQKSGAAGNESGGGSGGSGSTGTPEKKDDPQKTKGDKQSKTTLQPPTTAPSSTGKNTTISSTVTETKSDAANIGITAPVLGALVFLFLLPLTILLIVLP